MANNNNKHSKDFFKKVPISEDEGLRDVRDKLTKASADFAAGKIMRNILKEIGLEDQARQIVRERGGRIPTLTRIKIGRILAVIAALPLFTSWVWIIAIPLIIPVSPAVWVKEKMIYFSEWRGLR